MTDTARLMAAGGVVFRRSGTGVEVALVSVRGGKKPWALPKGLREEGEGLARTAHREVKEETGLDGRIIANLGHIEYFFTLKEDRGPRRCFKMVYFFLMECTGGDTSAHDEEVVECRFFPIDEAIRLMGYEDEKGILRKAARFLKRRNGA